MTSGLERGAVVAGLLESAAQVLDGRKARNRERGAGHGYDLGSEPLIVGVGWATVDLDRATGQFSASLGVSTTAWRRAPRDAQLGAEARVGPALGPDAPRLILLEPDTEGRLAASLARLGEGVAVVYIVPADARNPGPPGEGGGPGAATTRPVLSARQPGPLGPARLVLGAPAW
ncbi:MAG: hypothetical protein ACAH65_04810, partial [Chloroflexota bacterium]